jgi:hypothetical protein
MHEPADSDTPKGVLRIDAIRRRQMRDVLEFVRDVHTSIDTEQNPIDLGRVTRLLAALERDDAGETYLTVGPRDTNVLVYSVWAAQSYITNWDDLPLGRTRETDLEELVGWLLRREHDLFGEPPTIR